MLTVILSPQGLHSCQLWRGDRGGLCDYFELKLYFAKRPNKRHPIKSFLFVLALRLSSEAALALLALVNREFRAQLSTSSVGSFLMPLIFFFVLQSPLWFRGFFCSSFNHASAHPPLSRFLTFLWMLIWSRRKAPWDVSSTTAIMQFSQRI